jgi:hypothetical protein
LDKRDSLFLLTFFFVNFLATQHGRIEINIHAARGAKVKQRFAVCHAPQWTEETFDDAAALKSFRWFHAKLFGIAER